MQYEMVLEIYNSCSRNKMRDIFFEERDIADLAEFIRKEEPNCTYETEHLPDGVTVFHVKTADLRKKYSFTPLDES